MWLPLLLWGSTMLPVLRLLDVLWTNQPRGLEWFSNFLSHALRRQVLQMTQSMNFIVCLNRNHIIQVLYICLDPYGTIQKLGYLGSAPSARHSVVKITIFVNLGLFRHFDTVTNIRTWIKSQILEDVVRCKYFKAGVHIKNPIKNLYQDGLGLTTQTLDHVVVVHISIWDKRKSQINEYNDVYNLPKLKVT